MGGMKNIVSCVCRKTECSRLTDAFGSLDPVRAGFVQLPPTPLDFELGKEEFAKQLREAYLDELFVEEDNLIPGKEYYIALHHFHPRLLKKAKLMDADDENIYHVPRNLSKSSAEKIRYAVHALVPGTTDRYFCVPDYRRGPSDLRNLMRKQGIKAPTKSVVETHAGGEDEANDRGNGTLLPITEESIHSKMSMSEHSRAIDPQSPLKEAKPSIVPVNDQLKSEPPRTKESNYFSMFKETPGQGPTKTTNELDMSSSISDSKIFTTESLQLGKSNPAQQVPEDNSISLAYLADESCTRSNSLFNESAKHASNTSASSGATDPKNTSEGSFSISKLNPNQSFDASITIDAIVKREEPKKSLDSGIISSSGTSEQSLDQSELFSFQPVARHVGSNDESTAAASEAEREAEEALVESLQLDDIAEESHGKDSTSAVEDSIDLLVEVAPPVVEAVGRLDKPTETLPMKEEQSKSALSRIQSPKVLTSISLNLSTSCSSEAETKRRKVFARELDVIQVEWKTLSSAIFESRNSMESIRQFVTDTLASITSYREVIRELTGDLETEDDSLEALTESLVEDANATPIDYVTKSYYNILVETEPLVERLGEASRLIAEIEEAYLDQTSSLLQEGENSSAVMRQAELECQENWDAFEQARRGSKADAWFLEAKYKASVGNQLRYWTERSEGLQRVFEDFSEVEANRLFQVRDAVSELAHCREYIFSAVKNGFVPFSNLMSTRSKTYDEIQANVLLEVENEALLEDKSDDTRQKLNSCMSIDFKDCVLEDYDMDRSALLVHAEIVEIMAGGVIWKKMISGKTVDDYLHLTPDEPGRTKHDRPDFSLSLYKCEIQLLGGRALLKSKVQTNRKLSLKSETKESTAAWVKIHQVKHVPTKEEVSEEEKKKELLLT